MRRLLTRMASLMVLWIMGWIAIEYIPSIKNEDNVATEWLIGVILSVLYAAIDDHGHGIKLWFQSCVLNCNKRIRVSMSYLFRIKVDGKYLLIRGNRLKNQYQPVGGVYKYYPEAKPFLESINYEPDQKMNNSSDTDDLRISIKGKEMMKFLDWFNKMENREYDPLRELDEELFHPELVDVGQFGRIVYRKTRVYNTGVVYSTFLKCDEMLQADIFEIVLTDEQKKTIRKAVEERPESLCLATAEEIRTQCYGGLEKNLGTNTPWILEGEE